MEDRLGLAAEASLLAVVTPLALGGGGGLAGLLLPRDGVGLVLVALGAVRPLLLGKVDHVFCVRNLIILVLVFCC